MKIKKVALVSVHEWKTFHVFIYGRPLLADTDHKPHVDSAKRGLANHSAAAKNRACFFFFQLQIYDLQIERQVGKELVVADALRVLWQRNEAKSRGMLCPENLIKDVVCFQVKMRTIIPGTIVRNKILQKIVLENQNSVFLDLIVRQGFQYCWDFIWKHHDNDTQAIIEKWNASKDWYKDDLQNQKPESEAKL